MALIVQKFGGTSLADITHIKNVAQLIADSTKQDQLIIIVSAMAGVTNSLINKCNQLSPLASEDSRREYDAALASGEIVTASLLALELQMLGLKARSLQGWQVPIITDNKYSDARIKTIPTNLLENLLAQGIIPIITGFQGIDHQQNITTLGKGGSDTSAALIAAAVKAERCDIYTDVEGVYSADPRLVNDAHRLEQINIDELCILCTAGAKILHPRAALAAKKHGFALRILSTFTPAGGTYISTINKKTMEKQQITAITSDKNLLKIDLTYQANYLHNLYEKFAEHYLDIKQIQIRDETGCYLIANLTDKGKIIALLDNLKQLGEISAYGLSENIAIITLVGYGVKNNSDFLVQSVNILSKNQVKIIASQICDIKLSLLIGDQDTEKSVKLLHSHFIKK